MKQITIGCAAEGNESSEHTLLAYALSLSGIGMAHVSSETSLHTVNSDCSSEVGMQQLNACL